MRKGSTPGQSVAVPIAPVAETDGALRMGAAPRHLQPAQTQQRWGVEAVLVPEDVPECIVRDPLAEASPYVAVPVDVDDLAVGPAGVEGLVEVGVQRWIDGVGPSRDHLVDAAGDLGVPNRHDLRDLGSVGEVVADGVVEQQP